MNKLVLLLVSCTVALILMQCAQTTQPDSARLINNPEYGPWQDEENPPARFEKVKEWAFEDDELLVGSVMYLNTDTNGNIYFLDRSQSSLLSFDNSGQLRWKTGQKGKGPGDFEFPMGIFIKNDTIYVNNVMGSRMDFFDLDGQYLQSRNTPGDLSFARLKGATSSGHLVLQKPIFGALGNDIFIVEDSDSLDVISSFSFDQTGDLTIPEGMSAGAEARVHGNTIIFGSVRDYTFTTFDTQGNKLKIVQRDFDRILHPGVAESGGSSMITNYGGLFPPVFLNNGYYLTTVIWPTNVDDPNQQTKNALEGNRVPTDFRSSIDLFSPEDRLLYSFESEGFFTEYGSLSHVDDEGSVYFVRQSPEVSITKYELIIDR